MPTATPVTRPSVPTVALAVLVLVQAPPATKSERVIEAPPQTVETPLMLPAEGVALTVTTTEA